MSRGLLLILAISLLSVGAYAQPLPIFPKAVSPKYAGESADQALTHTCRDQYEANKASNGSRSTKGKADNAYMSECVKRLAKQTPSSGTAHSIETTAQSRGRLLPLSAAEPSTGPGSGCQAPLTNVVDASGVWGQGCLIAPESGQWRYWCRSGQVFEFAEHRGTPEGGLSRLCGSEHTASSSAQGAVVADQRSAPDRLGQAEQEKFGARNEDTAQSLLRHRQPEQPLQERFHPEQAQVQKPSLRQKLLSQYGIDVWPSHRELVGNPFIFRGRVIGLSVAFGQMLSDKEAVFGGAGDVVVARVPSTMFRGNESVILAARIIGSKSVRTATGGEINVPYLEFVNAWPLAEKRAQIIRALADALALAGEIQDGQIGALIERAFDEVLTLTPASGAPGGTVGLSSRFLLERGR
jgi:hypothetical protein